MASIGHGLPAGVAVLERGWLSSNNIVLSGRHGHALVDSGYCTHAQQTIALVEAQLAGQALDLLVNTHLHSDHCGGNQALQARFPRMKTLIPPGHADAVARWDPVALSYTPTGQQCDRFRFDDLLVPGQSLELGNCSWEVHAAPGHDPHSVILFEPVSRTLISADALWENGFGVVFPELDGEEAFAEVAATLDLIEKLRPALVVPGHGRVFEGVAAAIGTARRRLDGFVQDPARHGRHAMKVLLKFKLLEMQAAPHASFMAWALGMDYVQRVCANTQPGVDAALWVEDLIQDLIRSGAARRQADMLLNT